MRLGLPMAIVLAVALALIAFLNHFNYQKGYRQLTLERYRVVALDARQAVESGLNLGLSPASNTRLPTLLTALLEATPGLSFIAVADPTLGLLAASGRAPALDWKRVAVQALAAGDKGFHDETRQYLGLPARNSHGAIAGVVLIAYPLAAVDSAVAAMRTRLILIWAGAALLAAVLVLAGCRLLLRGVSDSIEHIDHTLQTVLDPDAALPDAPPSLDPTLAADLKPALAQLQRVARAIDEEAPAS
jgi:hypothetical protein